MPVRMVGMLAKGDRDHSSLRQGSNTKNQDHSWQKSANMSECSGGVCPVLKLLVGLFGIH